MAKIVSQTNFSRGINTDVMGIDGSLMCCVDMYPWRSGELRTRGGKLMAFDDWGSANDTGYNLSNFNEFNTRTGHIFSGYNASTPIGVVMCRAVGGGSFTRFTQYYASQSASTSNFAVGDDSCSHNDEIIFKSSNVIFKWAGALQATASGSSNASSTDPGSDEVVTLTGANLSSGTFTLSYGGETTSGIAYNASAATIDTAFGALASIGGVGNITTAGGPINTTPVTITFDGSSLNKKNVGDITVDRRSLNASGFVTVSTVDGTSAGSVSTITITGDVTSTVKKNMYIYFTSNVRWFRILDDPVYGGANTTFTVDAPPSPVLSGDSWRVQSLAPVIYPAKSIRIGNASTMNAKTVESHLGRVFFGGVTDQVGQTTDVFKGERIYWSGVRGEVKSNSCHTGVDYIESTAHLDIGEGIGGNITKLHSFGNELVIVKQSATYVMPGNVTTKGRLLGASVRQVSPTIGSNHRGGSCLTPLGVVIANNSGVYLYNGNNMRSMLTGRLQRWWDQRARRIVSTTGYRTVSCIGHRIIIQSYDNTSNVTANSTLVYDIDLDSFTEQTNLPTGKIVRTFDSSGYVEGDLSVTLNDREVHNWDGDLTNFGVQDVGTGASYPRPKIALSPTPLGNISGLTSGRINNVFLSSYANGTGYFDLFTDFTNTTFNPTSGTYVSTETYGSIDGANPMTNRIPITDYMQAPYASVYLYQHSGQYVDAHIYGIGVEIIPSDSFSPEATNV